MRGIVYLLFDSTNDYIYKIGVTRGDINKRIKKLQTGNSGEIFMVQYYETNYPFYIEKTLHRKYEHVKIKNEWYKLTDQDALNFKKTCKEIEDNLELLKDTPFYPKKLK